MSSHAPRQNVTPQFGAGTIVARQTTYWVLESAESRERTTVHFRGKREFHFESPQFPSSEVFEAHPLLIDYSEPRAALSFKGRPQVSTELASLVDLRVREVTNGWRSLDRYRNQGIDAVALLESGSGVFLEAPVSILNAVRQLLEEAGLIIHELERVSARSPMPKALVLGSNFVIADSFATEQRSPAGVA